MIMQGVAQSEQPYAVREIKQATVTKAEMTQGMGAGQEEQRRQAYTRVYVCDDQAFVKSGQEQACWKDSSWTKTTRSSTKSTQSEASTH